MSSKNDLDEDGFQVVRYRQRNKMTHLKLHNHHTEQREGGQAEENGTGCGGGGEGDSASWPPLVNGDLTTPSRALQLRVKFSSPSRQRSVNETLRKAEEKQAKAQEAREKLLEQKAGKFKGIVKKVCYLTVVLLLLMCVLLFNLG